MTTDERQNLANEIESAVVALNSKFHAAETVGLHVVARINESLVLDNPKTDKRTRIEAALLQPIRPNKGE